MGVNYMSEKVELFNQNKLRIALTNACNLSCFYCHNEGQKIGCKRQFLSYEYIKQMVEFIIKNNVKVDFINITGGEPTLHKDLIKIIDELKKLNCKIRLNTNATLLTKEKIDELKAHGVYSLKIGIDSIFAKQSKPNVLTNKASLDQILENIKYASKIMGVVLNTVVTKFNYKDIDKLIQFTRDSGINRIKIIKLNDSDSRNLNLRDDIANDFKTNQAESNWYYYIFTKYVTLATKTINNPHKGRTDLYFDDNFEIRFCDDICTHGACGNMYTEINANGDILICQRRNISAPVDFTKSYNEVATKIKSANSMMCNSLTKTYKLRDEKYNHI